MPVKPCPICNHAAVPAFKPFCSRRCADVDLARWLGGNYAIPVPPDDDDMPDLDVDTTPQKFSG
ncbi:DNA gyrase inhibitor YacG [Roseinatronobacter sp.]|uniref:DNA gyrase inhibitor YacG n=1 Tax=Roseinatronobacter sp. TaxID=1945755 RepID=UPI003F72D6EE